ncbi:RloB family protein [Thalassospira alkalitolerans]|uniref:CRISPR-associated protein n=1 Tax=Thalassospira alkalitolerans TaxID=1293890 RepID=A0A1Y2L925_9PROT|nr:RloB family protein [Thalassospira alkalitolerans]OSQ46205.1 hypothetical protein TALK_16460 [Thalassospira alkalitolerans]
MARSDKLFQKRKAVSKKGLERKKGSRKPNIRVLIVTEGERTEKDYFNRLISHLNLSGIDVDVCADCDSAPISVVNFAEQKVRSLSSDDKYDKVFCVFDRDTHETYHAAISKIISLNKNTRFHSSIYSVTSIPCFEFWFIIHFQYTRAPYCEANGNSVGDMVVDSLKKIAGFSGYDKKLTKQQLDLLISNVDVAIKNSQRISCDVEKTGEVNPSTRIHEMILVLKDEKEKFSKSSS